MPDPLAEARYAAAEALAHELNELTPLMREALLETAQELRGALWRQDPATGAREDPLPPPALQEARAVRLGTGSASPSRLYRRAVEEYGGPDDDATRLYRHAMIEAGYVVSKETGEPFDPCPTCNWSPNV